MNQPQLTSRLIRLLLVAVIVSVSAHGLISKPTAAKSLRSTLQYDDPYSDFRNVRYSNAGLLNERDEIKLGAQLHRESLQRPRTSHNVFIGVDGMPIIILALP